MRRSLTVGTIWLALGAGAVALAPAADLAGSTPLRTSPLAPAVAPAPTAVFEPTWPVATELRTAARVAEEGVESLWKPVATELHTAVRVAEEGAESLWKRPGPEPQPAPRMTAELARELNAAAQALEAGEHAAALPGSKAQVHAAAQQAAAQHSHSVLQGLIAAAPDRQLNKFEVEAQIAAAKEAAPAPPPEPLSPSRAAIEPAPVPTRPAQPEPEQLKVQPIAPPEPVSGWGRSVPGGDFCADKPIYDGASSSPQDCRKRCTGLCRFWSYWYDSVTHRCKLTAECSQREHDARHDVAVHWRMQDATDVGIDQATQDDRQASPNLGPQEVAVPEASQTEVEPNQTCSPRGSARKFHGSPESGGWHNLGKAHSYFDCANTAASMAYRNLVWNVGSTATGRCYGFNSALPDVIQRGCEDTYCWLFGPACKAAGQGGEKGQNLVGAEHKN